MKSQVLIYERRQAQSQEYWKRELVVYDSLGELQLIRVIKYQSPRKSGDDYRVTETVRVGSHEWSEQYTFKDETRALEFFQSLCEHENQIVIVEGVWGKEVEVAQDKAAMTETAEATSSGSDHGLAQTGSPKRSWAGLWKRDKKP